jgi:hypothetical protein
MKTKTNGSKSSYRHHSAEYKNESLLLYTIAAKLPSSPDKTTVAGWFCLWVLRASERLVAANPSRV